MHAHGALKYVIVGDGPHRPALEALARHMGIESLVHFAGEVPDRELARWYAAADVFALCSEERRGERSVEGFGIVFLEASASGLPVVGTKAGGIPDAVADGETGLLVPPGDPDAVAHAIGRLLQDNELALRMGSAGRDRVLNQFNWGNTAIALSRELQSLLPGSSLRPQAR
jgi:phosphatidylinositol alpha-1,6-mannosyltransferase